MKDNHGIIGLVYTFFLGVMLAIFVGVAINTFYPGPKAPEFPVVLNTLSKEPTSAELAVQKAFDVKMEQHNKKMRPYNRNVSMLTLTAAVILLAIGLIYENRIKIIADGVLLGGLFTLLYSIGRGFASENSKYMFIMTTIGLAIVIYLGYHRFVQEHNPESKSRSIKA